MKGEAENYRYEVKEAESKVYYLCGGELLAFRLFYQLENEPHMVNRYWAKERPARREDDPETWEVINMIRVSRDELINRGLIADRGGAN